MPSLPPPTTCFIIVCTCNASLILSGTCNNCIDVYHILGRCISYALYLAPESGACITFCGSHFYGNHVQLGMSGCSNHDCHGYSGCHGVSMLDMCSYSLFLCVMSMFSSTLLFQSTLLDVCAIVCMLFE